MNKAIVFIFCFYSLSLLGQGKKNILNTILFEYTHQFPFGDLAKDYGDNSSISMGYMEKTKQNWIFEIEGSYIFGYKIKSEDLFDGIATLIDFLNLKSDLIVSSTFLKYFSV